MFVQHSESGYRNVIDKVFLKTLAYGKRSLMSEFRLQQGAKLPRHSHPHEQTGYLVKGRIKLTIDRETFEVEAGDSWCIRGGIEHQAESLEESLVIEVFSPVREDYLPEKE